PRVREGTDGLSLRACRPRGLLLAAPHSAERRKRNNAGSPPCRKLERPRFRLLTIEAPVDDLRRAAYEVSLDSVFERAGINRQRAVDRLDRLVDIRVLMRVADDERRRQDAPADYLLKEERAEGLRGLTLCVTGDVGKTGFASDDLEVIGDPMPARHL